MKKIVTKNIIQDLKKISLGGVYERVDLSEISRWKIGGKADCLVRPRSSKEVSNLISYFHKHNIIYVVIGSTSNLLFSDKGLRAVCIQIGSRMCEYKINGNIVWAEAGIWVPGFARNVARSGFTGIEHTAGIPGTLGGLIYMNGGSQRKGIGSHVIRVKAITQEGEIKIFNQEECDFGYRSSIFQQNKNIIVEAELQFKETKEYPVIRNEMLDILRARRAKFPQELPNCGSTFISNPDIYREYGPPGKIIEDLGYKGLRKGGAEVSKVHANFINNIGNARAKDVLSLIIKIQEEVKKQTGYKLETEVKYVNELGRIDPAGKKLTYIK